MKLYLISQGANEGYDTYDSAVVCAPDEAIARCMHPFHGEPLSSRPNWHRDWVSDPEQVTVVCIGEAAPEMKQGIVCASFNAG